MALQAKKMDFTLTAQTRSQSFSTLLVKGLPGGLAVPALFTRMSILPSSFFTVSKSASNSACLVTSVLTTMAFRPRALTSSATLAASSTFRSAMATSAPSLAMHSTMPRPMPWAPPVTMATFPASRMVRSFLGLKTTLDPQIAPIQAQIL